MKKRRNILIIAVVLFINIIITVFAEDISFIDEVPKEITPSTYEEIKENITQEDKEEQIQKESLLSEDYSTTHPTPSLNYGSETGMGYHYWNTPMDINNPQRIWEAMSRPITVLEGKEKDQYQLRAEPSLDADVVGDVTYSSQGVHVLETLDNGWALVETYSSSFHYSKVKVWGDLVKGYVETKLLKEKPPVGDYGIVIDKMTQRMYIIKEGELYTTMIISTGLATESRPYQETRSGEYIIVSAVGDFKSDDGRETYELALRYNAGDLIHKVPYILRGETKNFTEGEALLGERASHGCIRVQRKRTPEGVNLDWLWKNKKTGIRVWIWEDYQGRKIETPKEDLPLYYNPNGGKNYHSQGECYGVKDEYLPLTPFAYGQLEQEPYHSLTPCEYCNPPLKKEEIHLINMKYSIQ